MLIELRTMAMSDCYHVTFGRNLPSIRAQGLLLRKRRVWKNTYGVALGELGYLYVCLTRDAAIRWAARMEWEFQKPIVILRLHQPAAMEPDPNVFASQDAQNAWRRVAHPIPASEILEEIPLTRKMIREAVQSVKRASE